MARQLTQFVKSIGGGGGYKYDQHILEFKPNHQGDCACTYQRNQTTWCVPPGISTATFHIWGSGGWGGHITGCGIQMPGGSGAYAYKTIDVTPGDCYELYSGYNWCGLPQRNMSGNACTTCFGTWVNGNGLTNFCAEQGHGGCGVCCDVTGFTTLFDSDNPMWSQAGAAETGADSEFGPDRACYYGADGGLRGRKGFVSVNGLGYASSLCNIRFGIPYNKNDYSSCGGHTIQQMCCNTSIDTNPHRIFFSNMDLGWHNAPVGTPLPVAGMGSGGNIVCGGNAACGMNSAGKIIIFYS